MNRKRRYVSVFAALAVMLIVSVYVNLITGSVDMTAREVMSVLFKKSSDPIGSAVLMSIRLPRICAAIVLGGALALSGYLLQTFFDNPIVGPFVLGISSGAKLTVALFLIFFVGKMAKTGSVYLVISAFIGALIAMGFVLLVSLRVRSSGILVVCGIMTGYICSAITDLVVTFADDANIVNLHNWSLGSLSGTDFGDVIVMTFIVLVCLAFSIILIKPIGAYRLGESYAASGGVNVKVLRVLLILISSLLAAVVTAFAGPISFVGIATPHLVKGMTKTSSPAVLIPGSFLCGALVTLTCDCIARTIFAPAEVSISSVTAVFLVPVVIFVMIRRKRR